MKIKSFSQIYLQFASVPQIGPIRPLSPHNTPSNMSNSRLTHPNPRCTCNMCQSAWIHHDGDKYICYRYSNCVYLNLIRQFARWSLVSLLRITTCYLSRELSSLCDLGMPIFCRYCRIIGYRIIYQFDCRRLCKDDS